MCCCGSFHMFCGFLSIALCLGCTLWQLPPLTNSFPGILGCVQAPCSWHTSFCLAHLLPLCLWFFPSSGLNQLLLLSALLTSPHWSLTFLLPLCPASPALSVGPPWHPLAPGSRWLPRVKEPFTSGNKNREADVGILGPVGIFGFTTLYSYKVLGSHAHQILRTTQEVPFARDEETEALRISVTLPKVTGLSGQSLNSKPGLLTLSPMLLAETIGTALKHALGQLFLEAFILFPMF